MRKFSPAGAGIAGAMSAGLAMLVLATGCAPADTVDDGVLRLVPAADSLTVGDTTTVFAQLTVPSGEGAGARRRIELSLSAGIFTGPASPFAVAETDSLGVIRMKLVAPSTGDSVLITARCGEASATATIVLKKPAS